MNDGAIARAEARLRPLGRMVRFYGVGAINTAFGYGIYAGFVALGVNLFVAQILSQLIGMTFNYFTYSRAVFSDRRASRTAYVGAYALNYLVGLTFLALFNAAGLSPYLSGICALVGASLVNFVVLKRLVFKPVAA